MSQTKQHFRGGGQTERPVRLENENDAGVHVTRESMEQFLNACRQKGRTDATVCRYGRLLESLYEYLPEEKKIQYGTLEKWRDSLLEKGYLNGTINSFLSVTNVYLDYIGHREYQVPDRLKMNSEAQPELSREEYLRMLQTARRLGKDRVYLLIKLFGTTDLSVHELSKLTVEAVKDGKLVIDFNRSKRIVRLSTVLRKELLDFITRKGYISGPIFQTKDGRPMNRAYVTRMIRAICPAANVPEEKGSTRCLQKLYQSTRANIESDISRLIDQAHDRLLEQEQQMVGWEQNDTAKWAGASLNNFS